MLEEVRRLVDDHLLVARVLLELRKALGAAPDGDSEVVGAVDVHHRNLDAIHLFEALQAADEDPAADSGVVRADQVLVRHGGTEAVRDDADVLVAFALQEVDRKLESLASIRIERNVETEDRGAREDGELDG